MCVYDNDRSRTASMAMATRYVEAIGEGPDIRRCLQVSDLRAPFDLPRTPKHGRPSGRARSLSGAGSSRPHASDAAQATVLKRIFGQAADASFDARGVGTPTYAGGPAGVTTRPKMAAVVTQGVCAILLVLMGSGSAAAAEPPSRELVIFEAASLKEPFARLAQRFRAENAGVEVVTNAAGSQELRAQIEHGAGPDVFASADRRHMDALVAQGLVLSPSRFACNEPVLILRAGLAATIKSFADLPRAERIVVGAPEVPIGSYTLEILGKSAAKLGADFPRRVEAKIVSREPNVRQALAKVVLGEADAAIVYRSDARAARVKVAIVEIPPELNVTAEYPIAALKAAPHPDLARRFIELVRSSAGQSELHEAGFVPCARP